MRIHFDNQVKKIFVNFDFFTFKLDQDWPTEMDAHKPEKSNKKKELDFYL